MEEIKCDMCYKVIRDEKDLRNISFPDFLRDHVSDDYCLKCFRKFKKNYFAFRRRLRKEVRCL